MASLHVWALCLERHQDEFVVVQFPVQGVELFFAPGSEGSGDGYIFVSAAGLAGVYELISVRVFSDNGPYYRLKRLRVSPHDLDREFTGKPYGMLFILH